MRSVQQWDRRESIYLAAPPLSLHPRHVPVTDLPATFLSLRQIVG
jgi:hypothetical protein